MTSVGAIFNPYPNPPEAMLAAATAAESSGVAELWLWEDCFRESAFAAASAVLACTSSLRVGIGIAPMPLRNVAVTAMEIATVARMFPGRLLPGLGHGVQSWMSQVGARVGSPLTLMREYLPALRRLLAGDEVTTEGRYVTLDRVRLDWPPAVVPLVYAAAEGPKTLRLSGAVADGSVLDSRHTVGEIAEAVAAVLAGHAEAGSGGDHDVVAYVSASFGPEAIDRIAADWEDGAPADLADRLLAGTVTEVAAGVRRFAEVGVDRVILLPPRSEPDLHAYYARVGEVAALI